VFCFQNDRGLRKHVELILFQELQPKWSGLTRQYHRWLKENVMEG